MPNWYGWQFLIESESDNSMKLGQPGDGSRGASAASVNVATVAANSLVPMSASLLPMTPGVGASVASDSSLHLFLSLLNALTGSNAAELPLPGPPQKIGDPVTKEAPKNKKKENSDEELQTNYPVTLVIEIPPAVIPKLPIILDQTQGPAETPASPLRTPGLPDAAVAPNSGIAVGPSVDQRTAIVSGTRFSPIASTIAFTAQLTPVSPQPAAPQEVKSSPQRSVLSTPDTFPVQASQSMTSASPEAHQEPIAVMTPKEIIAAAAKYEDPRPAPIGSNPIMPVVSTATVDDESPNPQSLGNVPRPDTAPTWSATPRPEFGRQRQSEPTPDSGMRRLEPGLLSRQDSSTRPKNDLRTAGLRTEEPRKKPEPMPAEKTFAEPNTLETSRVSRPAPAYPPAITRGNTPAVMEVNQDPAPVKSTPKSETNLHTPAPPTREISLRVADVDAAKVDVRLSERAGKVHVAVRTDDRELAKSLQSDLGELVGRLERKGYSTETWTPGERLNSSSMRDMSGSRDDGSGSGWTQQQDGQSRGDSHRRGRRQWEAEMGQRFDEGQSETNDDQSN